MKTRTDFHSVNLSTGEKTRSIVGDGQRIDETISIESPAALTEGGPAKFCPACGHYAHRKAACRGGMGDYCDCAHDSSLSLVDRITKYLENGGLFNPEQMDHSKVRELLVDCRSALIPRKIVHKIKLEEIKHDTERGKVFAGCKCLIWAGDGGCYWLANYCGYGGISDAGIYDFEDAFEHSRHCGPEKRIEYHFLSERNAQ